MAAMFLRTSAKQLFLTLCLLLMLARLTASGAHVIYVNGASNSAVQDGTTWASAYSTLEAALQNSGAFTNEVVDFWIAKGVYKPTTGLDRSATFSLRGWFGANLTGGFVGNETNSFQANPANLTILSGDIGVPDDPSDNSFSVLTLADNN